MKMHVQIIFGINCGRREIENINTCVILIIFLVLSLDVPWSYFISKILNILYNGNCSNKYLLIFLSLKYILELIKIEISRTQFLLSTF